MIEISSGNSIRNEWSKAFADVLQSHLTESELLKGFKSIGDYNNIYFKASKTATIIHNDWIPFHIECLHQLDSQPITSCPK